MRKRTPRDRRSRPLGPVVAALAGGLALAGCGSGGTPSASDTPSGPNTATAAPTAAPTSPSRTPTPTKKPKPKKKHFSASVIKITKKSQVKHSWHAGCPVSLTGLRMIEMTYHGMDDKIHTGRLVVAAPVAHKVISVFRTLYHQKYPIRRMKPVDEYGGSDFKSIDADNTSAFNCRSATGSSSWSEHAYGKAIDLNPCENPYVEADGTSSHKHCRKYNDRSRHDRGLVHSGDKTVDAFAKIGWGWGGVWSGARDYQHFSESGR